ncbi:MAG: hypothetical protein QNK30_09065 [Bacteroidales bacterium]|nr:hypothetical protein [Bacteroidales bacterium]
MSGRFGRKILVIALFAIAMGFLEAIVVVYVRELFYPDGFTFPLKLIPEKIFYIELVRELTTLVMLLSIGLLAGKRPIEKFSWFLFTFGIWDINYYIALKTFLDWPATLLTWDVLFLIPVTWIGPVLAPVICSLTMILFALVVIVPIDKNKIAHAGRLTWTLTIIGALLIFISFIYDYTALMSSEGYFSRGGPSLLNPGFIDAIAYYIPTKFKWWLFLIGEGFIIIAIGRLFYQNNSKKIPF